jgi:shikimate kinase
MQLQHHSSVILVGPMASGKTTLGKLLSKRLNLQFVDSDQDIEKRSGVSVRTIFEVEGEDAFRDRESKAIAMLVSQKGLVVATGGGAVLREQNRMALRQGGLVLYLKPDIETQLRRTTGDRKRPLLQNVDRRQFLTELNASRDPFYRQVADLVVKVDNRPGKKMIDAILAKMAQKAWVIET